MRDASECMFGEEAPPFRHETALLSRAKGPELARDPLRGRIQWMRSLQSHFKEHGGGAERPRRRGTWAGDQPFPDMLS